MAKCSLCGKSGLFLSLDKNGLCKSCAEILESKRKQDEILKAKIQKEKERVENIPLHTVVIASEKAKRNTGYPNPHFSNITPKGKYYDFVVFDTETTGLSPSSDRIIELAAIKFVGGFPVEAFHTYVNPQKEIPEEASAINKIRDKDVASAPIISNVIAQFDDFVGDNILVAHNLDFDLKFVYYSGSQLLSKKNTLIDTLEQARRYVKKSEITDYKLDTLCDHFNIPIANQHSALYDAFATGKLFLRLVFECQETMPSEIYNFFKITKAEREL